MSTFIKVSMLTINTDHIVYIRELASEYIVAVSSVDTDLQRKYPGGPAEFERVANEHFHFTKGRPETAALEKWLKEQGE
jgi:hypothetical protein